MSFLDFMLADPLASPPPFEPVWDAKVEATTVPGRPRIYHTPDGDFPSVTSVLGYGEDMSWLDAWAERIGKDKADRISERSRTRGTRMHDALEAAIKGKDYKAICGEDYESLEMARAVARAVFPRIDRVIGSEAPVWSTRLRVAGRLDCAAIVDGVPTLVDFKNARRLKTRDDIHGYFLQCSLYAAFLLERTGIWCPNILIAIGMGDDRVGQQMIFEEKTEDWLPLGIAKVREYWSANA